MSEQTSERDPRGKRALFESPPIELSDSLEGDPLVESEEVEGAEVLFSAGAHRPGTVTVDCSRCGVRSRMSLVEVGVRIVLISLWIPGKHYSRWMQCPECERRTWCRVHWLG